MVVFISFLTPVIPLSLIIASLLIFPHHYKGYLRFPYQPYATTTTNGYLRQRGFSPSIPENLFRNFPYQPYATTTTNGYLRQRGFSPSIPENLFRNFPYQPSATLIHFSPPCQGFAHNVAGLSLLRGLLKLQSRRRLN